MKTIFLSATLLLGSVVASELLAQGYVIWGNYFPGFTRSPVYGVDPENPAQPKSGNTPMGVPAGTQTYAGPPLQGTGFTLAIYLGANPAETMANNAHVGLNTLGFRTGLAAGFMFPLNTTIPPSYCFAAGQYYQVRVWENGGGTITSWSEVMAASGLIAAGETDVGAFDILPCNDIAPGPTTYGFRSFQLTVVPEPSLIALGALGLGALLLRPRK